MSEIWLKYKYDYVNYFYFVRGTKKNMARLYTEMLLKPMCIHAELLTTEPDDKELRAK